MTLKEHFHQLMRERRMFPVGSYDHIWRTRAARKFVWIMNRRPVCDWPE